MKISINTMSKVGFKHKFLVILIAHVALAACGGGGDNSSGSGGGTGSAAFSINTSTLSFSSPTPYSAAPAAQSIIATVNTTLTGTLYVLVSVTGSAVANVSNIAVSGNSGSGSVAVKIPAALGVGTHTSTISIRACLNDSTCATGELSGSPRTVNVTYTVGAPVLASTVMPHVVTAGKAGQVVLRGSGFTGTSSVNFGGTAVTSFTVVSDSMIQANYPTTLFPGSIPITLTGSATSFSKSVIAVGQQSYSATTLTYPESPDRILAMVFDSERQSIFVAAMFTARSNNKLWRYRLVNGLWSTPDVIAIPELRDIALSADGTRLYALTTTAIQEIDAANPSAGSLRTVTAPFASNFDRSPYLVRFALANDGCMFVTTGELGLISIRNSYLYLVSSGNFIDLGTATATGTDSQGIGSGLVASADGSLVIATQNQLLPYVANALKYMPATGLVSPTSFSQTQFPFDQAVALDSSGSKIVVTDYDVSYVWNSTQRLGLLADRLGMNRVVVVNPLGTRAYAIGSDLVLGGTTLFGLDLSIAPTGSPATFWGSGNGQAVAQAIPSVNSQLLRTAITPDGATFFVAGDGGVAVIPAPN